jgi:hypothetical protein
MKVLVVHGTRVLHALLCECAGRLLRVSGPLQTVFFLLTPKGDVGRKIPSRPVNFFVNDCAAAARKTGRRATKGPGPIP